MFINDQGNWVNVLREYGNISMASIRTKAERWVGDDDMSETRIAQNNIMACQCIRNTSSQKGLLPM